LVEERRPSGYAASHLLDGGGEQERSCRFGGGFSDSTLLLHRPPHRVEVSRREFVIGVEEAEPVPGRLPRECVTCGCDVSRSVMADLDLALLKLRRGKGARPGQVFPLGCPVGADADRHLHSASTPYSSRRAT